jgi:hypothetical protein
MSLDKQAKDHIEECHIIIDLQREELAEKEEIIRALKGELLKLRQDRRYEVA